MDYSQPPPPLPAELDDFEPKSEDALNDELVKHENSDSPSSAQSPLPSESAHGSSASRRPTRKSTLTQQQKNQKRQRATQDQLGTLEIEFNKNPTPNASVRERIAQEINMTERSVQIWFQNRRAKIKNLAKKSIENGEECDAIPESMRRYLAMQALESGNPLASAEYFNGGIYGLFGNGMMPNADASASKVMILHLSCRSLNIGSWRRIGQTQLDLVVFYSPTKSMVTYYIQAENTGFRIEYPFSSIKSLTLDHGDKTGADGADSEHGCIVVELFRQPQFTMDQGSNGWYSCRDFTEDHQASKVLVHRLGGHPKVLGGQLSKLTSLDAYTNRLGSEDQKPALASPLPLMENRPSSQPNHLVHPQSGISNNTHGFQMGPPAPRGHKRQRSRSVPMGIEFGPRRQPLPAFMLHQHQHQHHHVHHHNPLEAMANNLNPIFAPIPQYAHPVPYPQHQLGYPTSHQPMRIDPSAGLNFDFGTPAPPSTTTGTTATTPPSSEFEHSLLQPSFSHDQSLSAPPVQQQAFPAHFLSPVAGSPTVHDASVSPMSALSRSFRDTSQHVSPGISPPSMQNPVLFRSASADPRAPMNHGDGFYSEFLDFNGGSFSANGKLNGFDDPTLTMTGGDFADAMNWPGEGQSTLDALLIDDPLLDPMSKQPLNLPFRSSLPDQLKGPLPPATPPPLDNYEFSDLVTLDPLTPENDKTVAR